jgi:hypothetical protein
MKGSSKRNCDSFSVAVQRLSPSRCLNEGQLQAELRPGPGTPMPARYPASMKGSSKRNCDRRGLLPVVVLIVASMKGSSKRNCDANHCRPLRTPPTGLNEGRLQAELRRGGQLHQASHAADASMKGSSKRNCDAALAEAAETAEPQ